MKLGSSLGSDLLINGGDLSLNEASASMPLGALATTGDGRYFRYVKAGGSNLVPGKVQSAPAETTGWQDLDFASAAAGDTSITTTSTVTLTANQLAGGFLVVTNGTGAGYTYQIKSHPAVTGAVVTLQLFDAIQVSTPAGGDIDLVACQFNGVVLAATTQVAEVVGVAVTAITASQFGWIQVRGPVGVLVDAAGITVGGQVAFSDETDGAVGPLETDVAHPIVGIALTGGSSTEYALVNLQIS